MARGKENFDATSLIQELKSLKKLIELVEAIEEQEKRYREQLYVYNYMYWKKHLQEEKARNRRIGEKESEELKKRIHIWPCSVRSITIKIVTFVDEKHNSFCLVEFLTKPTCDNNYKVKIFDVRWASGVIDICLP